jgi:cysteine desulfurase/selenocysteine lyase
MIDLDRIRSDFPHLQRIIDGSPVVYLDSANTSQKPAAVINAMQRFTEQSYAPINRSAYRMAAAATDAYENARTLVANFINAGSPDEVVFTKNATESLNLFAQGWSRQRLQQGDVVVLTHMEHHANIVPWQMMTTERGIDIRWIPLTDDGRLDLSDLDNIIDGASVVSFTSMSNVLGTMNPVREIVDRSHAAGAIVMVDACQSVPHAVTDVQAMGADLIAFSGHKMLGPSGIGVLWGRPDILDQLPPLMGGGNMIDDVRIDTFSCAPVPAKFEAGTPPIIEAIGLGTAVEYLSSIGMAEIRQHEMELTQYALDTLTERFGSDIVIHGPKNVEERGGVLSFAFRDLHPHDVSQILDEKNVCVRAGHHCAKPLMRIIDAHATVRASLYLYNDTNDVDILADALTSADDIFGL